MDRIRFVATEREAGQRADRAVLPHAGGASRARVQRCIDAGGLLVNGRPVKPSHRLKVGDPVELHLPLEAPETLQAEEMPLDVVHRDAHIVILNKPAGLVVHPGAGNRAGTLANALLHHFGALPGTEDLRPGIVHRLDRDTSGLLIVTLTAEARERFSSLFSRRQIHKEYAALVYGAPPADSGRIDKPIGRHPVHRLKMTTHAPRSRASLTEWAVERRLSAFTLLAVTLHTGRTHQIRVHLASIGHPIVGDTLYGGNRHLGIQDPAIGRAIGGLGRFFLHARRLRFEHPCTGLPIEAVAPLPAPLRDLLAQLAGPGESPPPLVPPPARRSP